MGGRAKLTLVTLEPGESAIFSLTIPPKITLKPGQSKKITVGTITKVRKNDYSKENR
ncbi:hypothetical protein ES703_124852 [subsurface metagenome]